jgi:hypothetical protein
MKHLISMLVVFLLMGNQTLAQDNPPETDTIIVINKPVLCGSEKQILAIIETYNEKVHSAWIDANNKYPVMMYANWKNGTTTVIEHVKKGFWCAVSTGVGAAKVDYKKSKETKLPIRYLTN